MVLPENCSIDQRAASRHGVHEIAGPLLQRFEGYLEFRDKACQIAASQMVSMIKSPADLFLLTKDDAELFDPLYAEYVAFCEQKLFLGDKGDGSLSANISTNHHKADIKLFRDELFASLNHVRRYFVYRKGLLKLDFVQWNSDPEEVLKRLKTSTRWSELGDDVLKRGLESHMQLLKKLKMSKVISSELETVAMERINLELSSELENYVGQYDRILLNNYFKRMRYTNLARECATQAQMTGIIFLEESLPIRAFSKEQMLSTTPNLLRTPYIKQAAKKAFEGSMSYLHRINKQIRLFGERGKMITIVLAGAVAGVGALGNKRFV
ncbi:hypothetical protein QOZ80_2AG0147230 [Eleusine coracana subsp. coracana]|nr:hypothetical protein QOZ80_2AG0147230 [Eleusine coracana subsp. coracana]